MWCSSEVLECVLFDIGESTTDLRVKAERDREGEILDVSSIVMVVFIEGLLASTETSRQLRSDLRVWQLSRLLIRSFGE